MRKFIVISLILLFSLCINVYQFLHPSASNALTPNSHQSYPLLAAQIFRDDTIDIINNFLPLRQALRTKVAEEKDSLAFYFEYLPTGVSIGINQDAEFTPASLLKVAVVMAYFHKKERLALKDDPTVTITEKELNNEFGDLYKKGAGSSLKLDDAVKQALQESDNTASLVIADYIDNADYEYVNEGLDIDLKVDGTTPIITAQEYSSILKALYYASIVNRPNSQYILDLLTKTRFKAMLPSGVPSDIPIAHKIGLIDKQIYSDCGIVYVPRRPYLLCIISRSDLKTATERIKDISNTIYTYVNEYKLPQ